MKLFDYFSFGRKTWEIRAVCSEYNPNTVYCERAVVLRLGYSGESISGAIASVITGSLRELLESIDYREIIPVATSLEEAASQIERLAGKSDEYIAFKVDLATKIERGTIVPITESNLTLPTVARRRTP